MPARAAQEAALIQTPTCFVSREMVMSVRFVTNDDVMTFVRLCRANTPVAYKDLVVEYPRSFMLGLEM